MQNDFLRPGAPLEIPSGQKIIPRLRKLVSDFTSVGAQVIYTRYIADENLVNFCQTVPWVKTLSKPIYAFRPGFQRIYEDGVEAETIGIIDTLSPPADALIVDKTFYSSFSGTDLHKMLLEQSITTVFVSGVATEACVDDSARSAVHLGYQTAIIGDATASRSDQAHRWTLENFGRNYGLVMTVAEVLDNLSVP